MKQIKEILLKNNLVRTSCREEIIQAIVASDNPLSEEEIKSCVSSNFNRTTFYRTFKTLLAKEIIHKIVVDNTLVKYALSQNQETEKQHAHFFCLSCKKVLCLPQIEWKYSNLPNNFKVTETELLIKGYCNTCN